MPMHVVHFATLSKVVSTMAIPLQSPHSSCNRPSILPKKFQHHVNNKWCLLCKEHEMMDGCSNTEIRTARRAARQTDEQAGRRPNHAAAFAHDSPCPSSPSPQAHEPKPENPAVCLCMHLLHYLLQASGPKSVKTDRKPRRAGHCSPRPQNFNPKPKDS
jgi:hypothetical protein